MNIKLKAIGTVLMVAVTATSVFGQVRSMGVGKSVVGVTMDPKKFNPQIDKSVKTRTAEKDHEMKFDYPVGQINNLVTGGVLPDPRINFSNGSFFPGISATGWEPPDPDIAVGPTHIVEVVNSSIAFIKKDGTKVLEQTGQKFFQSISPEAFDFDPKIIYDQIGKRFVMLDLGLNDAATGGTSSFLIGVSNTPDPTGTWKLFKVDVKQTVGSNNYWLDYPGIGYNNSMVCMTGNMFAMTGSSGFNGVQIICFDKAALYSGTATPTKFSSNGFTMQLAKTEDSTTPCVYGVETESNTSMRITAISKTGSAFNVTQASVTVPQWSGDQGFITGPGGVNVQTNDPRQLVATSFNGRVLSSHSVAVSNNDGRPAARWYDFKTNNWPISAGNSPSLNQSGQLNPPAGHGYSFPAIQIDKKGGVGMTFSMIGSSTPGKVMGTGRRSNDPLGTMGNPIVLDNSTAGTYTGFSSRWGDYFDLELDPLDSTTFWAVGMGAGNAGKWQTYIKSFKISVADPISVFASGFTTVAGTWMSGTKANLNTIDNTTLDIQSQLVSGLGQVAGFNSVYSIPFGGAVEAMRVNVTASGPTGASAIILLKNYRTGAFDQISTMGLSPTGSTKGVDLSVSQIANYVSSTKQVSLIVRAVNPARSGKSPTVYIFRTDRAMLDASEAL